MCLERMPTKREVRSIGHWRGALKLHPSPMLELDKKILSYNVVV